MLLRVFSSRVSAGMKVVAYGRTDVSMDHDVRLHSTDAHLSSSSCLMWDLLDSTSVFRRSTSIRKSSFS